MPGRSRRSSAENLAPRPVWGTPPSPRSAGRRAAPSPRDSPAPPPPRRRRPGPSPSTPDPPPPPDPAAARPPALVDGVFQVYLPVPAVIRCPRRGCRTSYSTTSWSLRVRYLQRHLSQEHGVSIERRENFCSTCDAPLPPRSSGHNCSDDSRSATGPPKPRFVCPYCSREFVLQRYLRKHVRRHERQGAAAPVPVLERRPPATRADPGSPPPATAGFPSEHRWAVFTAGLSSAFTRYQRPRLSRIYNARGLALARFVAPPACRPGRFPGEHVTVIVGVADPLGARHTARPRSHGTGGRRCGGNRR
ncbi:hypothetical protein MTO96_045294 [Rhipicephalus appendiculatus]